MQPRADNLRKLPAPVTLTSLAGAHDGELASGPLLFALARMEHDAPRPNGREPWRQGLGMGKAVGLWRSSAAKLKQ